ncbi:MAG: right-handed parallel beta-helix repeat-containing protein, partial [Verrucomicrobiae bacterium]|nr:right-handed parallel beta-helix repeat-containing protein [Verrucomicrobiae bacterium]
MQPVFFRRVASTLLLAFTLATAHAAESCDSIRTFADGKSPLREIFISPTGHNSTGNGSQANPYQTISRALQGVQPGDAIRLLPGIYPAGTSIGNLAGTSDAPIWLGGVPGQARPVISGGATAMQLSRVRYVILENLEVAGATANGINCDDGGEYANSNATRHVIFRNLFIHDIGTGGNNDGLKLSGVNDYFVLDCEFARMSTGGSGIDHVGCHGGVIARNKFTDAGSNAIQCKGGSEDIDIRWNSFTNAGARAINLGGSTGFQFFRPPLVPNAPNSEAKNIRVIANLFHGSDTPVAFVGAVNSLVANNTIIQPTRWLMRILQETVSSGGYTFLPCGQSQFINNLVYFDRSQISTYVNIGANTDAASFEFANNLWYAFNQPSHSQPTLPAPETNGVYALNPLFHNPTAGDYSVATNSPATGKGRKLPNVRADLRERCYAAPPSIGAYESKPPAIEQADYDGDLMPDIWEEAHGLDRLDPADAVLDADKDGLSNLGEYLAGTDPNDPQSVFKLHSLSAGTAGFSFRYSTVTGRLYRVQARQLNLLTPWSEISFTNGTGGEIEFMELASDSEPRVFRVRL